MTLDFEHSCSCARVVRDASTSHGRSAFALPIVCRRRIYDRTTLRASGRTQGAADEALTARHNQSMQCSSRIRVHHLLVVAAFLTPALCFAESKCFGSVSNGRLEHGVKLPASVTCSRRSVPVIFPKDPSILENDGHEKEQIHGRTDHWVSASGRGGYGSQGVVPQARLQ